MFIFDLPTVIEITLLVLINVACCLFIKDRKAVTKDVVQNKEFAALQHVYLFPYFMSWFAGSLQGPYVYKLYRYYGFSQDQIAILYVVGYASSVTIGTLAGPIADKFGRKKVAIASCLLYSLCYATKLYNNFILLIVGRIFEGIIAPILYSVFESWYIHEHTITKNYPVEWMSLTFSKATFFNGLLAILAGILGQGCSEWINYGPVSPFMAAIPCILVATCFLSYFWTENYGERNLRWWSSCVIGLKTILGSKKIMLLCMVQSLFEANMYIFIFLWTPVLEPGNPPLGLTFASFMVATMIGSSIYSTLIGYKVKPEKVLGCCLAISGVSLFICGFTSAPEFKKDFVCVLISFFSFVLLEISVGMYYPCISHLRGEVIPDNLRANIMGWFGVPMNVLTCGALLGLNGISVSKENERANQIVFLLCSASALLGYLISYAFSRLKNPNPTSTNL